MVRARISAEFSPTPPVNTIASSPFIAAAMAATEPRSRCRYTSRADRAAMTSPSSGVKPIVVSTDFPSSPWNPYRRSDQRCRPDRGSA